MKKLLRKDNIKNLSSYILVIVAFVVCQILIGAKAMPSMYQSLLIPVCVYIVMALSLNLTVGILGELSLGHAGFMSVGALTGVAIALEL